jgi:DNA-nicking Smr family endonuclease
MRSIVSKDKNPPSDDELFRQMMEGVEPLAGNKSADNRLPPEKPRPSPKPRPATADTPLTGFIAREHIPEVGPEETLFFSRTGLQHRLLRQLKRGELRPEAQLDLHGQTIIEAGIQLAEFLAEAQDSGRRCVCVVHGKGHRSSAGRPVLKAQVNQWLRDAPEVLAFSSAQAKDGGMGALYILLRRHAKR